MSIRTLVHIAILTVGVMLTACQEKEEFGYCLLTEQMLSDCAAALPGGEDQCTSDDAFCGPTCMVTDHPECSWGPCINFKYRDIEDSNTWKSDPFCAVGCSADIDCPGEPGDSKCQAMPGLKVPCASDTDCTGRAPWAECLDDGYCTWHVCIPRTYAAVTAE